MQDIIFHGADAIADLSGLRNVNCFLYWIINRPSLDMDIKRTEIQLRFYCANFFWQLVYEAEAAAENSASANANTSVETHGGRVFFSSVRSVGDVSEHERVDTQQLNVSTESWRYTWALLNADTGKSHLASKLAIKPATLSRLPSRCEVSEYCLRWVFTDRNTQFLSLTPLWCLSSRFVFFVFILNKKNRGKSTAVTFF